MLWTQFDSSTWHDSVAHCFFYSINFLSHSLWVACFSFSKLDVCEEKVWIGAVIVWQSGDVFTESKTLWIWMREDTGEMVVSFTRNGKPLLV